MNSLKNPFSPTPIFWGFVVSVSYGVLSAIGLRLFDYGSEIKRFAEAYFATFNCALAGGLVFATALTVWRTRHHVCKIIEETFTEESLKETSYYKQRCQLFDMVSVLIFSAAFSFVAFVIFFAAGFGFKGLPEFLLIGAGCLQYALGVYVGRTIFYIARMLQAVEHVRITTDIFTDDRLSGISSYVNYVSTLTAISVYIGAISYYGNTHFMYQSVLGNSISIAMLLPAVIAVPVLLFSYYPRIVIRKLYERSIECVLKDIINKTKKGDLSEFEVRARTHELRKSLRDELSSLLRNTLEDLPMAAVVGIALLSVAKT